MDWTDIRNEYITTDTSYRKLAEKHNVSFASISNIAKVENWVDLRKQAYDKTITKFIEKSAESEANKQVRNLQRVEELKEQVLDKCFEILPTVSDTKELRAITQSVLDIEAMFEPKVENTIDMTKFDEIVTFINAQGEAEE